MSIYKKILIPLLCVTPFAACSESSDDGGNGGNGEACPYDYSTFQQTKPEVSLRNDLLKAGGTLRFSCSFDTTCHGSESRSQANLYLGTSGNAPLTEEQINLVYENLVNHPSAAAPTIPLVDPGKPENSFVMMKLDGCLEDTRCVDANSRLTEEPCGSLMPEGNKDPLPKEERDLIRTWIAQGAPNN